MLPIALIPVLAALHTIGALIGTVITTIAEIFYTKAAADGRIDHHERKYLRHLFHGLRFGMSLVLLSGIALIVVEFLLPGSPQAELAAPFWTIQTLTLIILLVGIMLSQKKIVWWLGSAAVLTAWWMILATDLGFFNSFGYIAFALMYVVTTLVVAAILSYVRMLMRPAAAS